MEDSGSTISVLEITSIKVLESDVKMKVLKGTKDDFEVSGGG